MTSTATARACANIAFIKYWGNSNHDMRLPANTSLSMNLAGLHSTTSVRFNSKLDSDSLTLNGEAATATQFERVSTHLDHMRQLAEIDARAEVTSENSFPMGAGIASSASAFAALTLAACAAAGLDLPERELSRLARMGSGSASRSVPGGFVEWHMGSDHQSSFAESIAPPEHWDLVDLIAIVSEAHKAVGSTAGHSLAESSPLQSARLDDTERRLEECRSALLERDFATFAGVVEQDTLQMHAVMMTSNPPLLYWQPATFRVMQAVSEMRNQQGLQACFTIDAGPNVHVICPSSDADAVEDRLTRLQGVERVLRATVGNAAQLV